MAIRTMISGQEAAPRASASEPAWGVRAERAAAAEVYRLWALTHLPRQVRDGSVDDGAFDEYDHGWRDGRYTAFVVPRLVAVRLWQDVIDVNHDAVQHAALRAMNFVLRRQRHDGQLDLSGSYSPNEAGFPIPALATAYGRLRDLDTEWSAAMCKGIEVYIKRAAEAIVAGEAMTANHRWAAAAAPLAAAHRLFPDERYVQKIESYLADGIDCDADGCWYEERSPGYNNVANHGMLVLAQQFDRPELLDHVVRNVTFMLHQIQPNGETDTSYSFRQDRGRPTCPPCNYRIARRAAMISGDGRITQLALQRGIAQPTPSSLKPLLFDLDEFPGPMPAPEPLPDQYQCFFPGIQVARLRRAKTAITVSADAGGHFFDSVRDQWGGPHRSEDWFQLHYGDLVIQSIQLVIANHHAIQPTRLKVGDQPGQFSLSGEAPGWVHTAHFRPGWPKISVPWNLSHQIEVSVTADQIEIKLRCVAPQALAANLSIWVRQGATFGEERTIIEPGEQIMLTDGKPVELKKGSSALEISGLPEPAHMMPLRRTPAIPTDIQNHCGTLSWGLRPPFDLNLRIRLL